MINRDRLLQAMSSSLRPLDDDELARRSGVAPRQAVNAICRELERIGIVRRFTGPDGKVVNELTDRTHDGAHPPGASSSETTELDGHEAIPPAAGNSAEQRQAEGLMLEALGSRLGVSLTPRRIVHPSGAWVAIDGADEALSILVECWAHQGTAKVAQKSKLVVDATKLHWIAKSLDPPPSRLILCLCDPAAMSHLNGRSWQAQAIRELGVEFQIVTLDPSIIADLTAAQKRQYR